jgi:elongation factor G
MAFREGFANAKPVVLEPIMKVEVDVPVEYQGAIQGQVNQRRGIIMDTKSEGAEVTVLAEVPLSMMFGYSTDLRSATQGKGNYTMEFSRYSPVPRNEQEEMIKKHREKMAAEAAARK